MKGEMSVRTENELNWEVAVCAVCAGGLLVLALGAGLVALWKEVPELARGAVCAAGTLLAAAGLWLCAWECGRRFEREHGARECGEKDEG